MTRRYAFGKTRLSCVKCRQIGRRYGTLEQYRPPPTPFASPLTRLAATVSTAQRLDCLIMNERRCLGFFYAKMTTMTVDACANPYRFLFDLIRRRPLKSPIGLHRRMNPLLLVSSPTNFRQTSCLVSFMSPVCCCFLVRCSRDVYTETKTNVKSVKKTWQKIEKNYFVIL